MEQYDTDVQHLAARLSRSRALCRHLNESTAAFTSPDGWVTVDLIHAPDGRSVKAVAGVPGGLPVDWAISYSELVHHLRSALDNAAHLVHCAATGAEENRQVSFPIFDPVLSKTPMKQLVRDSLVDVPETCVDYVKALQPPDGGPDSPTLLYLTRSWNADKHRFLSPWTLWLERFKLGAEHGMLVTSHAVDDRRAIVTLHLADNPTPPDRLIAEYEFKLAMLDPVEPDSTHRVSIDEMVDVVQRVVAKLLSLGELPSMPAAAA